MCVFFCLFVWLHCTACGILFPWPGIEPVPLVVEAGSLNNWTAREVCDLMWVVHWRQKVEMGEFDGQSYVSTWLGCNSQLINQTLMWVLLWMYFVDLFNIYNQLTLSKRRLSWKIWVGQIQSVERLCEQSWGFPEEEEIPPADCSVKLLQEFPACPSFQPALRISDLPGQPLQLCKPIPCNKSLPLSLSFSLSFYLYIYLSPIPLHIYPTGSVFAGGTGKLYNQAC